MDTINRLKKIALIALATTFLVSCGPRRMRCGPYRCMAEPAVTVKNA